MNGRDPEGPDERRPPPDEGAERPSEGGRVREGWRSFRSGLATLRRGPVLMAGLGVAGFVLAGVMLLAGISFWWTSQPSFCARCHVMEPFIAAWEESPHREVNCERCHLKPGFFGCLGGKIGSLQVVMDYVRGEYKDWSFNAAVTNASCLQCHESILDANIHTESIEVSHRNIVEAGGKCMSCHSTVAHGEAVPVGSETHPSMAACLRCHNDEVAPLRCGLCHVGRAQTSPMPVEAAEGRGAG